MLVLKHARVFLKVYLTLRMDFFFFLDHKRYTDNFAEVIHTKLINIKTLMVTDLKVLRGHTGY